MLDKLKASRLLATGILTKGQYTDLRLTILAETLLDTSAIEIFQVY